MELSGDTRPPQACLVNFYDANARMGCTRTGRGRFFRAGAVVSLGDACLFRIGGTERGQPTRSFRLESGDIVVLGGSSRLAFQGGGGAGVDRIYPTTSTLLRDGGRINLTLRRVSA